MAMLNNQRVRYLIDLEETTVVAFDIRIQSFPEFPASEASDFSVLTAGTCTKRGNKQHWALGIRWKDCMYIYIWIYPSWDGSWTIKGQNRTIASLSHDWNDLGW